jgi:hypothetical protein
VAVDGANAAHGDVTLADLKLMPNASGYPGDAVFQRVVAEQAEMAGAAAGRCRAARVQLRPQTPSRTQVSRLGVRADSSPVLPPALREIRQYRQNDLLAAGSRARIS